MGPTLVPDDDRSDAVERLVERAGGRVGLEGVLADLGRSGRALSRPGLDVAFTWDDHDRRDRRWWPQGVSGAWDVTAGGDGTVLLTTAYAKPVDDVRLGCRLTVHDLSPAGPVRYEHVLLVAAQGDASGDLRVRPVHAHAGGVAWVGRHVHVTATTTGFHSADPADIVRADRLGDVGLPEHGHRYLLPVRTTYRSVTPDGAKPLRYSFLSVAHESHATVPTCRLLVGEYGLGERATTRLWTHDLDPVSGLPLGDEHGVSRPAFLRTPGTQRMQGAVLAQGRLHVVTSLGRFRRGSIWTERGGRLAARRLEAPPGPEDLSHRPATDQLWSLTEYPYSRMVLAVDRSRFV